MEVLDNIRLGRKVNVSISKEDGVKTLSGKVQYVDLTSIVIEQTSVIYGRLIKKVEDKGTRRPILPEYFKEIKNNEVIIYLNNGGFIQGYITGVTNRGQIKVLNRVSIYRGIETVVWVD